MTKSPPTSELEFVRLTANHAEFARKLDALALSTADVLEYAKHVCTCWFHLAEEHLAEARTAFAGKCTRTAFSRSYYAAYNASKAVRYLVHGVVSLKGDDHGQASTNLPKDLNDVARWSQSITILYEHRLRADYDNWGTTLSNNTLTPEEAIANADAFIETVRDYINTKFGMQL